MVKDSPRIKLFKKVLKRFKHEFVVINGKEKYLPVLIKGDLSDLFVLIEKELEKNENNKS